MSDYDELGRHFCKVPGAKKCECLHQARISGRPSCAKYKTKAGRNKALFLKRLKNGLLYGPARCAACLRDS